MKANYTSSLALSEIASDLLSREYPGVKIINVLALKTVIISRTEIKTSADLKNKRVRAAGSVQSDVLGALGAVPTLVQPGDMNDALDKGMIEAVSTAYSGIESYKLDDVGKFIAEGEMGSVTFATVMNEKAYNALPADLRRLIDESSGVASAKLFAAVLDADEVSIREGLIKRGIKISTLADDGSLRGAGNIILDQAIKKAAANDEGAAGIVDKMRSAVAKYTANH